MKAFAKLGEKRKKPFLSSILYGCNVKSYGNVLKFSLWYWLISQQIWDDVYMNNDFIIEKCNWYRFA